MLFYSISKSTNISKISIEFTDCPFMVRIRGDGHLRAVLMRFQYIKSPAFAKLTWLCQMRAGEQAALVYVGDSVEARPDFYCEGAWAGDFEEGEFSSSFFTGTGARIDGDAILFSPPEHTLDRMYRYTQNDVSIISNSLSAILSFINISIISSYLEYNDILGSPYNGLKHFRSEIPLSDGSHVTVHLFHNFRIDSNLLVTNVERNRYNEYHSFDEYKSYLDHSISSVFKNASSESRICKYEPITTISSGYDSTAIAALAAAQGCREALTFTHARGRGRPDDSGEKIGERLGLTVRCFDRLAYRMFDDMPEIETQGAPCELSSAREVVSGRLLLTGFAGDGVWDRDPAYLGSDIVRVDASGSNWGELRLRWGFIHFPVAFLGIRELSRINMITKSKEMAHWTLGGDYDRPICRRIIEEAGVPRGSFAQEKKAAGVYATEEGIENVMNPNSLVDFKSYTKTYNSLFWKIKFTYFFVRFFIFTVNEIMRKKVAHKTIFGTRIYVPVLFSRFPIKTRLALLTNWSIERLTARRRAAATDVAEDAGAR